MKTATAPLPPLRSVKVLDQLRERIRYLHYSLRTEQAYVNSRIDARADQLEEFVHYVKGEITKVVGK